jgi:hypothetical protein
LKLKFLARFNQDIVSAEIPHFLARKSLIPFINNHLEHLQNIVLKYNPLQGYSPRKDLQSPRQAAPTTGKVIPELKFVFWQKMFTSRYDARVWDNHLRRVMPNLDPAKTIPELRKAIDYPRNRNRLP